MRYQSLQVQRIWRWELGPDCRPGGLNGSQSRSEAGSRRGRRELGGCPTQPVFFRVAWDFTSVARNRVLFVYGFVRRGGRVEVYSGWAADKGNRRECDEK
jgi:hypothetical protein